MIASTGSKIVSISRIPVSLIVSRIEALIASTASDDCKRLQVALAHDMRVRWAAVAYPEFTISDYQVFASLSPLVQRCLSGKSRATRLSVR